MIDLEQMQRECHINSMKHGFWDYDEVTPEVLLAKMMLVTSEVSEIMEAYRKEKGANAISEEFADTFIRLFDLYEAMYLEGLVHIKLQNAIELKMSKNKTRPHKHDNLL